VAASEVFGKADFPRGFGHDPLFLGDVLFTTARGKKAPDHNEGESHQEADGEWLVEEDDSQEERDDHVHVGDERRSSWTDFFDE